MFLDFPHQVGLIVSDLAKDPEEDLDGVRLPAAGYEAGDGTCLGLLTLEQECAEEERRVLHCDLGEDVVGLPVERGEYDQIE